MERRRAIFWAGSIALTGCASVLALGSLVGGFGLWGLGLGGFGLGRSPARQTQVATPGPALGAVRAQVDSMVWWYVARASGLIAWVVLGASVVGGLLLATRLIRGGPRAWTQRLHEFLGALAVVFTAIHLVSVFASDQLRIGLRELLVPFARPSNPVAQGCGVLAFYLLTAVALTSWARALLPWRWWRWLHLLAFPLFGLVCAHAVLAAGPRETEIPVPRAPRLRVPHPVAAPTTAGTGMRLLIGQTTWEADNVVSLQLHSPDGAPLPGWEPGAHIELALPSGRRRQYSLCGEVHNTGSYRIAILQVPGGRGGSVEVHTDARADQLITVQGPRNHFPLVPSPAYLFIAGGIGITALLAMATRVAAAGAEWNLVYAGRRRASMAFLDEVRALGRC